MLAAALCLAAAAGALTVEVPLPDGRFTLAWTHSIEKVLWEEDYLVAGGWLYLQQARVRGTGAGMEIPDGARLEHGVYRYRPAQRWHRALQLARSRYTEDYRLCIGGSCRALSDWVPVDAGTTSVWDCATERRWGSLRSPPTYTFLAGRWPTSDAVRRR